VDCAPCEAPDGHPLLKDLPRFHVRGPAEKLFEEAYDWARPLTDAECTLRHLVGIDVNMAFAAGVNGLIVGLGDDDPRPWPGLLPARGGGFMLAQGSRWAAVRDTPSGDFCCPVPEGESRWSSMG
jgi:hypothetical protein